MNLSPLKTILLAALLLFTALQPLVAEEQRWLLVFNTSAAMKKRLPAVEAEIKTLLLTEFSNGLHAGASLGAWTFNDKLHAGQFPLQTWDPAQAAQSVSNLVMFVRQQNYSGLSSFDTLQSALARVVADSERLTIVIICDGDSEIHWTPYNDGLNETIRQTREDRRKLRQPYVIVLRSQLGKFTGATVNFPPVPANLPPFPLLPREIKIVPRAPVTNNVAAAKPMTAAPLIIVGTHVSTNTNDLPKPPPPPTNQWPAAVEKTNVPPAANLVRNLPVVRATNALPVVAAITNAPPLATNRAVAAASAPPPAGYAKIFSFIGAGIFAVALVAVVLAVRRQRRPQSSLITSSLESDSRPPGQK